MAPATDKECILLVDDDPNMLELLRRHLCAQGYDVVSASAGKAIQTLAMRPIDLVITVLKMPVKSGHDLIEHIRRNFTRTEVIIVTGSAGIQETVTAAKAGGAEYLVKPFTEEELIASVQKALGKLRVCPSGTTNLYPEKAALETSMPNVFF